MNLFNMKQGNITVLGEKTEFIGEMEFSDNLIITGKFNGKIVSTGNLKIEKTAECEVSLAEADSILIAGKIKGDIEAKSKLEICSGSHIVGDVKTARLRIEDNVDFHGQVTMLDEMPDIDLFSVTAEEYKQATVIFKE